MSAQVEYADTLRVSRCAAVRDAIDAAVSPGKLLFCSGVRPAAHGAVDPMAVLVEVVLADPCGVVSPTAELVLSVVDEAMISKSGVVSFVRLQDGTGKAVADLSVGAPGGGGAITLPTLNFEAGSLLRITAAKITEA